MASSAFEWWWVNNIIPHIHSSHLFVIVLVVLFSYFVKQKYEIAKNPKPLTTSKAPKSTPQQQLLFVETTFTKSTDKNMTIDDQQLELSTDYISKVIIMAFMNASYSNKLPTNGLSDDIIDIIRRFFVFDADRQIFIVKGSIMNDTKQRTYPRLNCIDCRSVNNDHNIQKFKIDFRSLRDMKWDSDGCGFEIVKNVNIPNLKCMISDKDHCKFDDFFDAINRDNLYNVIFRSGGIKLYDSNFIQSRRTEMIIFENDAVPDSVHCFGRVHGYNFNLKPLPSSKNALDAQSVYSVKTGLITNSNATFQYKSFSDGWVKLPNMRDQRRVAPSICLINGDSKLFVAGGNDVNNAEIYDFESGNWDLPCLGIGKRCKPHSQSGICYDSLKEYIYFGGGMETQKEFHYFDLRKSSWISLANTKFNHEVYPLIWHHEMNRNIVYITGNTQTNVGLTEWIDLRENQWHKAPHWLQLNERYSAKGQVAIRRILM